MGDGASGDEYGQISGNRWGGDEWGGNEWDMRLQEERRQ